jgi:hypothetical protein
VTILPPGSEVNLSVLRDSSTFGRQSEGSRWTGARERPVVTGDRDPPCPQTKPCSNRGILRNLLLQNEEQHQRATPAISVAPARAERTAAPCFVSASGSRRRRRSCARSGRFSIARADRADTTAPPWGSRRLGWAGRDARSSSNPGARPRLPMASATLSEAVDTLEA